MKLAVFGGAGLAGGAVVRLAIERGEEVRALIRGAADPPPALAGADVVRGDALDPDAVAKTIAGADAVVSTLGGFRGPESISGGTENIIGAMRRTGPKRLVILQGFHIDFPGDPHNVGRAVTHVYLSLRCPPLPGHTAALGRLLRATDDIAWTLVRVPPIVDAPASGRAQTGRFALSPLSKVNVGDIAGLLLDLAGTSAFVHEAPMFAERTGKARKSDGERTAANATRRPG